MGKEKSLSSGALKILGMDKKITRRDFLNASLIGAGAFLLDMPSPVRLFAGAGGWDGYGGTGDYSGSHGDTGDVVLSAHKIRDGGYDIHSRDIIDTGEVFDLAIVGGGLSGLGAAFYFKKAAGAKKKCIIIENHNIFGGEANRNEFAVNGQLLIGPQASNSFVVIDDPEVPGYEIYSELGVPARFKYSEPDSSRKKLYFDRTNYGFMLWYDNVPGFGYFFENPLTGTPELALDIWERKLENTPFNEKAKQDFFKWRNDRRRQYEGEDFEQWLDTMTYGEYLKNIMGLGPEIIKFVDPVLSCAIGLGSDAISAFGAYQVAMPGFQGFPRGFTRKARLEDSEWHSFPGGNDGFVRHLVKALIPEAVSGGSSFEEIMNRRINFDALDRPAGSFRIRLGALAAGVEHVRDSGGSEFVNVIYAKGGKLHRLKARGVVMASAGFVNSRIVKDLPQEHKEAYGQFRHSPALIINVAVTNWNFLYKLGMTACRWFDGFGFSCNIRQPMVIGGYKPPLDPDMPAVITFYVPFYYPGLDPAGQGARGRSELLSASYRDYEIKIREQMVRLFGSAGFDPGRDIAGIILNRWGHAFVNPQPGFYFGRDGKPAPRYIIRRNFGRIAFAHSELNGHQHWLGAVEEGRRAVKQLLGTL